MEEGGGEEAERKEEERGGTDKNALRGFKTFRGSVIWPHNVLFPGNFSKKKTVEYYSDKNIIN